MAFLALLSSHGIRTSFQAFVEPWQAAFAVDRATISLVASISLLMYGLVGPVAGRLADRHGARAVMSLSLLVLGIGLLISRFATSATMLLVAYGVFASLGFAGASPVPATAVVTRWFPDRRGMAMSLMVSGFAAGTLVVSSVSVLLVAAWGWQQTLLVYGAGLMGIAALVAVFLKSDPDMTQSAAHQSSTAQPPGLRMAQLLRRREFWLLAIPYFVCGFTDLGFVVPHLAPFAAGLGVTPTTIAVAVATLAAVEVVGVLAAGYLSDRWGNRQVLAALYSLRIVSFALLFFVGANSAYLIAFAVVFGLTDLATIAPTGSCCGDLFDPRSIGMVFGWIALVHQIGAAVGSYAFGKVFDLTGSYGPALAIGIVFLALAAFVTLLMPGRGRVAALPTALAAGQR